MESKVSFVIVGVFVLVLGAVLIGGGLWLSSGKSYRKAYDTYRVYQAESVSGLNRDAPVKYRGVDVGRVRKIALAPDNVELVELTLDIERGTPIKEDSVAVLRTQGLTGIAYLDLSGGSRESPLLEARPGEEFPVIRSGPSLMYRVEAALTTLLANLDDASRNFNALVDESNRKAIKQTLADLAVLSRTVAARSAAIDSALVDSARAMENVVRVTGELSRLVERVHRSAELFDRMSSQVTSAGKDASGVFASARGEMRVFATQTLPEFNALVSEAREATASLRRLSEQLEQNPSILLYGRPAPSPGPGE